MDRYAASTAAEQPAQTQPDWSALTAAAVGGMLGGSARYGLSRLLHAGESGFPWATLTANISGSFLLGLAIALLIRRHALNRLLYAFVATGTIGSYTTFSALAVEASLLVDDKRLVVAFLYVSVSVMFGIIAALAGLRLGRYRERGFKANRA